MHMHAQACIKLNTYSNTRPLSHSYYINRPPEQEGATLLSTLQLQRGRHIGLHIHIYEHAHIHILTCTYTRTYIAHIFEQT